MTKSLLTIYTLLAILLATGKWVSGQNCGCAPNVCCSRWGFCGLGDPWCGDGCQAGPCYNRPNPQPNPQPNPPTTGGVRVADVVTDAFFNGIINRAGGGCAGRGFYSRGAFLNAVGSFPRFGAEGSDEVRRREIVAFFAHVTHETGSFCYIEEIGGPSQPVEQYCQRSTQYPCAQGRRYFGRGPIQLSWNYNYINAGSALNFDGLNNPDIVARDPVIAFSTALWFWMNNCHSAIVSGQGFGATIRAINGALECDGRNAATVTARVNYFTNYCGQIGVSPGGNLRC